GDQMSAPHALFNAQMHTLGKRVGQMHALLARAEGDEDFVPEPITPQDLVQWSGFAQKRLGSVLQALSERLASLPEASRLQAQRMLSLRTHLFERIVELTRMPAEALKTRHHGNLHLGKVLLAADDFLIFGFEGDTWLPLEARRRKDSPLRDLASLLN